MSLPAPVTPLKPNDQLALNRLDQDQRNRLTMKTIATILTAITLSLLLSACVPPKKEKSLDSRLLAYEQMIRWSEWDGAASFLSPSYLEENPITNLDIERLRLFRVTTYTIRSATPVGDGSEFLQTVEIRMFNRHQATEKVVNDQQLWRYDEDLEIWWLESGLPDVLKRY